MDIAFILSELALFIAFSLIALLGMAIWPATLLTIILVLRNGVNKEQQKIAQGNAQAAALLASVRSHNCN